MIVVVILVELGLAAFLGICFVVAYSVMAPWRDTSVGRHIMAFMVITTIDAALLFILGLGVGVPLWAFAIAFALLDMVVLQRLVLLFVTQRRERRATMAPYPSDKETT